MRRASVWINRTDRRDRYFGGYMQGDPLELALRLTADAEPDDLVEMIFVRLNEERYRGLGTLTVDQIRYYHTRFPSLSVGDVVEIDGQWFQIAPIGHGPIDPPHWTGKCGICGETRVVQVWGRHIICADCTQGDPDEEASVNEILDYEADNPVEFEPDEIDAALQDPNRRKRWQSRD
jgi:hypothetical protein